MIEALLSQWLSGLKFYLAAFAIFTALELFLPRFAMPLADRVRGLKFWIMLVPLQIAVALVAKEALMSAGVQPLMALKIETGVAGMLAPLLATILFFLVNDFVFYWFHRAQHRWLWRWHAAHHSIEHLSAVNSYHHWSEPLFYAALTGLPFALFPFDSGHQSAALVFVFSLQSLFIHSSANVSFGLLGRVLVDNRVHRIHHSLEPHHFDHNYGAMTIIWDWAFGTLHMPKKDEWPAVGLASVGEPRSVAEWESLPRRLRKSGRAAAPAFVREG